MVRIKFWNIVNKGFIFFTPPKNEKQKKKNQFLTNPNKPIPIIAQIIPIDPNTVFFIVSCIIIWDTRPKPGKIKI